MTSQKQLESFTAYCKAHPEERFWQALRNWSKWRFILGSNTEDFTQVQYNLHDTFFDKS